MKAVSQVSGKERKKFGQKKWKYQEEYGKQTRPCFWPMGRSQWRSMSHFHKVMHLSGCSLDLKLQEPRPDPYYISRVKIHFSNETIINLTLADMWLLKWQSGCSEFRNVSQIHFYFSAECGKGVRHSDWVLDKHPCCLTFTCCIEWGHLFKVCESLHKLHKMIDISVRGEKSSHNITVSAKACYVQQNTAYLPIPNNPCKYATRQNVFLLSNIIIQLQQNCLHFYCLQTT